MELRVLLIEDDEDDMAQLKELLPADVPFRSDRIMLHYEPCGNFEAARVLLRNTRYDLIVTDTYHGKYKQGPAANAAGRQIADEIMLQKRFIPVIMCSNSQKPDGLVERGVFLQWADKYGDEIETAITRVVDSGVPLAARRLHEQLDLGAGSYLWDFLVSEWSRLSEIVRQDPHILERLIFRRAAFQLAEMQSGQEGSKPIDEVYGAEFYIYPSQRHDFSFGEVIRKKDAVSDFRVVLTPHCFLACQRGSKPRADYVLTARAIECIGLLNGLGLPREKKDSSKVDEFRRLTQSPAQLGKPDGRYWYLPGFLDIPHLYLDLMQLESIPYSELEVRFDRIAVLDSPYAEALQSCFGRLYSTVGLPTLQTGAFRTLTEESKGK